MWGGDEQRTCAFADVHRGAVGWISMRRRCFLCRLLCACSRRAIFSLAMARAFLFVAALLALSTGCLAFTAVPSAASIRAVGSTQVSMTRLALFASQRATYVFCCCSPPTCYLTLLAHTLLAVGSSVVSQLSKRERRLAPVLVLSCSCYKRG